MCIKYYDMYDRDVKIGTFIEDWSDKIRGVHLSIQLEPNLNLSDFRYADLAVLQKDMVISHDGVLFWIGERCTPITQDGIKDKLKYWGMSEYDQLTIMHQTLAINLMDSVWVRFNENATFDKNHPNGGNFERVLPMHKVKHR